MQQLGGFQRAKIKKKITLFRIPPSPSTLHTDHSLNTAGKRNSSSVSCPGTRLLIESKSQFVHVQNMRYICFCWQNATWTKIPPPIAWYFILHLYYYSILPIAAPHAGKLKITWILRKYVCISCKFTILHNYYLHYYHPGNIPSCKFTILQFTILQIYRLANLLSCKFTILDIYYLANGSLGKILSWNFTILESNHLGKFVLESMTCNNESW